MCLLTAFLAPLPHLLDSQEFPGLPAIPFQRTRRRQHEHTPDHSQVGWHHTGGRAGRVGRVGAGRVGPVGRVGRVCVGPLGRFGRRRNSGTRRTSSDLVGPVGLWTRQTAFEPSEPPELPALSDTRPTNPRAPALQAGALRHHNPLKSHDFLNHLKTMRFCVSLRLVGLSKQALALL